MEKSDYKNLIDDMRAESNAKRLLDPEVLSNGHCATCDYRGYYHIEGSNLVRSCGCAKRKAVLGRLATVGVPRRFLGMAFDAIVADGSLDNKRIGRKALTGIKSVYVNYLDTLNAGGLYEISSGRGFRSVALVGGSRRVKSAWASQVLEEKGAHQGAFAYYEFGDLKAMLTDYKRMEEASDFVWKMGAYDLVVVDGVHGGGCGPGFPAAWGAGISARLNSGKATILLLEDNHDIDSYAWRDMLDDPDMLVLPFDSEAQAANSAPQASTAPKASPAPTARQVTTQDDAEAAILDYLRRYPDKIIRLIYENIPASKDVVKAALDSLVATGDVTSRPKKGERGTMIVFAIRGEGDPEVAAPKAITATKVAPKAASPGAKQLTYTELQEVTLMPRGTLWRWRQSGMTDDEIVTRAEKEAAELGQ